jgi:hypothetical protein
MGRQCVMVNQNDAWSKTIAMALWLLFHYSATMRVAAFTYPSSFVLSPSRVPSVISSLTSPYYSSCCCRLPKRQCLVCGVTSIPWEDTMIQVSSADYSLWSFSVSSSSLSWMPTISFPLQLLPLVQALLVIITYTGLVYSCDRPRGRLSIPDSCLKVAPSQATNGGMGLYVTSTNDFETINGKNPFYLPKGTVLGTYPGTVLRLEQNLPKLYQYPHCEAYIWRFADSKFLIDPTDERGLLQDVTYGGNPSTIGGAWICRHILNWCRQPTTLCRINEPPLGFDVNVITKEDMNVRTVEFILERDVFPGEELFIDYGLSYDRSAYSTTKS